MDTRLPAQKYLTYPTAVVLQSLINGHHYGFDIMDITGLPSGTVYPMLRRLEREGLVSSKWEDQNIARHEQRPQRRFYEITAVGEHVFSEAAKRYRNLGRLVPNAPRKLKILPTRSRSDKCQKAHNYGSSGFAEP